MNAIPTQVQEYALHLKEFTTKFRENPEFRAKVTIGHILTAKIFLDSSFEKYYKNFINKGYFHRSNFFKSILYIELKLDGDYTDRYSNFGEIKNLPELLVSDTEILESLRESIEGDKENVFGRLNPGDPNIIKDEILLNIVKEYINNFIKNQMKELREILSSKEVGRVRNEFLEKITEILYLKTN